MARAIKFDVDAAFHPTVPHDMRQKVINSNLYRPMLRILQAHSTPEKPLMCIAVKGDPDPANTDLTIGTQERLVVLSLMQRGDNYWASTADSPFNPRRCSTVASSTKAAYIATALCRPNTSASDSLRRSLSDASPWKLLESSIVSMGRAHERHIRENMDEPRSTRFSFSTDALAQLSESYAMGLPEGALSPELRRVLGEVRATVVKRDRLKAAIADRLTSMFANDKVFIVQLPDDNGVFVGVYNAMGIHNRVLYGKDTLIDIKTPLTYYPTLDAMPDDLREPLMAKLTMMSVVIGSKGIAFNDSAKFFPGEDTVIEGANYIADLRQEMCWVTFDR